MTATQPQDIEEYKFLLKPISKESKPEFDKIWKCGIDEQKQISDYSKQIDEIFEYSLRNICIPPIKGEITKGKIKWRGIKLMIQNKNSTIIKWLSQRGDNISPKIYLDFETHNEINPI